MDRQTEEKQTIMAPAASCSCFSTRLQDTTRHRVINMAATQRDLAQNERREGQREDKHGGDLQRGKHHVERSVVTVGDAEDQDEDVWPRDTRENSRDVVLLLGITSHHITSHHITSHSNAWHMRS